MIDVSDYHQKESQNFIDRLPANERKRVVSAIGQLPDGEDIKKLKGHNRLNEGMICMEAALTQSFFKIQDDNKYLQKPNRQLRLS